MKQKSPAIAVEVARPQRNWSHLVGARVEIRLDGERVCSGLIDQATSDDTVLWIAADGNQGRRLFDKLSGYEVWA